MTLMLLLYAGEMCLACPTHSVKEIIPFMPPTHTAKTPGCFLGSLLVRGTLVPIIDLKAMLTSDYSENRYDTRIVILNPIEGITPIGLVGEKVKDTIVLSSKNEKTPMANVNPIVKEGLIDKGVVIPLLDVGLLFDELKKRGVKLT